MLDHATTIPSEPQLSARQALQPKRAKKVPAPLIYGEIHRTRVREFLRQQEGKFVRVDFVKKDGSERTLVGRLGVTSLLKGGVNNVERLDRPYITMFDAQTNGYRAVNLATVQQVHAARKCLTVID